MEPETETVIDVEAYQHTVARRSQLTERYAPARHRFSCLKSQLWDIHLNS
jgi:hypothetical protein